MLEKSDVLRNLTPVVLRLTAKASRQYRLATDDRTSYTVVTAMIALILGVGLVIQLLQPGISQRHILFCISGITLCTASVIFALRLGRRFPLWFGLLGMAMHGVLTGFLGAFFGDLINVTVRLQEMPVIAMYVAWFYRARDARIASACYVTVVLTAAWLGPQSYLDNANSIHETLRLAIFVTMCTELGIYWRRRVAIESTVDELTGAFNRQGLQRDGRKELERGRRYGSDLTLVLIDLDGFKLINDQFGHAAGDDVLCAVVTDWKNRIRNMDDVYRLGGDEFILLLPQTSALEAEILVRRLRADSPHPWSWGIAQAQPHDTVSTLISRSDAAMYEFKRLRQSGNR